jgi:ABC-type multidrug transport system ATPase subunit
MAVVARGLLVRRGSFMLGVAEFAADDTGTALLGPNGAGKSTLLLSLQSLLLHAGSVERPARCAGVFAAPAVLRGPTLWNVVTVLRAALDLDRAAAEERATATLAAVGLADSLTVDARRLSSGQRQRLALARALALEPQALFLDEPFANVDADGRVALRELVRAYVAGSNCTLVIATQALADVVALCARVILLEGGRAVERLETNTLSLSRRPYLRALVDESSFRLE